VRRWPSGRSCANGSSSGPSVTAAGTTTRSTATYKPLLMAAEHLDDMGFARLHAALRAGDREREKFAEICAAAG
jgi:hypothetical protein